MKTKVTVFCSFHMPGYQDNGPFEPCSGIAGMLVPVDRTHVACTLDEAIGMLDPFQRNYEEVDHAA